MGGWVIAKGNFYNCIAMNLPNYDFSIPLNLAAEQRFEKCSRIAANRFGRGANSEEIARFEQSLGLTLPDEYRLFLQNFDYIKSDECRIIWGIKPLVYDHPWLFYQLEALKPCLVIGDYWRYADGDQLLLEIGKKQPAVFLYFHDEGLVEQYAPSFSLALWRFLHEQD